MAKQLKKSMYVEVKVGGYGQPVSFMIMCAYDTSRLKEIPLSALPELRKGKYLLRHGGEFRHNHADLGGIYSFEISADEVKELMSF